MAVHNLESPKIYSGAFEDIRQEFAILNRSMNGKPLVFLDSAASSQKPEAVINAIADYYRKHHANIHRGVYELSQEATAMFEAARVSVAHFINAASESEIIFTRGATESINLVASTLCGSMLKKGDSILLSYMEHHSNIVPWQMQAEKLGLKIVPVAVSPRGELDMADFEHKLNQGVKLVALTHVSNALGTINPVAELARKAHEAGALVLIDGCQAAPHIPVDVRALDVDFYAFSSHKMYGPTGIGVLYGKADLLNELPPYHGGGEMIRTVSFEKTTYNELPFKFEAGTPDIAGAIGLHVAIEFISAVGFDAIMEHEQQLLSAMQSGLSQIEGIRIVGEAKEKVGVVSFLYADHHPYDVGTLLDQMGIAVRTGHHCTQPLMDYFKIPGTVRASLGIYNTMEDVERLLVAMKKIGKMLG
jgi:cysteine desulfurase/selenocysteine lyase